MNSKHVTPLRKNQEYDVPAGDVENYQGYAWMVQEISPTPERKFKETSSNNYQQALSGADVQKENAWQD